MGYIDPGILHLMHFGGFSLDDAIAIYAAAARQEQERMRAAQESTQTQEKKEDPRDVELKVLRAKVEGYTRELGACESQLTVLGKENALLKVQVDNLTKKLEEAEAVKAYALKMAELIGGKTEQPAPETGITETEGKPAPEKVQEGKKCESSTDAKDAQATTPTPTRVKIRITPRRKE